jgi:hypothetical protein
MKPFNELSVIRVKVKFSLCLTKYHAMETFPMLN